MCAVAETSYSKRRRQISLICARRGTPSLRYQCKDVDLVFFSIDRYNHLIELEAEYASFGQTLTRALEDLGAANRNIRVDVEKIIQAHDRNPIVKQAPASLFSAKPPASIKRFCS